MTVESALSGGQQNEPMDIPAATSDNTVEVTDLSKGKKKKKSREAKRLLTGNNECLIDFTVLLCHNHRVNIGID